MRNKVIFTIVLVALFNSCESQRRSQVEKPEKADTTTLRYPPIFVKEVIIKDTVKVIPQIVKVPVPVLAGSSGDQYYGDHHTKQHSPGYDSVFLMMENIVAKYHDQAAMGRDSIQKLQAQILQDSRERLLVKQEILRLLQVQMDMSNKKWSDAEKAIAHTTSFMSNVPKFFYMSLLTLFIILFLLYRYLDHRLKRKQLERSNNKSLA